MQKQKSMQELTHYYQNVFTLKSGKQIKINTKEKKDFSSVKIGVGWKIKGFVKNPLLEEKEVQIVQEDVASIEITKKGCIAQVIPWPPELFNDDIALETPLAADQVEQAGGLIRKKKQPLAEHKSTCAIHNNPSAGFVSEVTQCDCGAIVSCTDNKPIEDMTTKEIIES